MSWVVLTWKRSNHKISFFTHVCYLALWRMIDFSFFCFHHLFDLIKIVVIYSLYVWLYCSLFIIYILTNSLYRPLNRLPSPSRQADSTLPLPAREINERKQNIMRELQVSFAVKLMLKTSLFCLLNSSQTNTKKRTKETSRSPLFTRVTLRFARA